MDRKKVPTGNGQAGQDRFVLSMLSSQKSGFFLEIGSNDPRAINNTYVLEKEYGWTGIMIEYDSKWLPHYVEQRPKSHHKIADASTIDYKALLLECKAPRQIGYLQIDLEVENGSTLKTLELLNANVFGEYQFAVVTFEHDIYRSNAFDTRRRSREIFDAAGYLRLFGDVRNGNNAFEDWYIHPALVTAQWIRELKTSDSLEWTDVLARIASAHTIRVAKTALAHCRLYVTSVLDPDEKRAALWQGYFPRCHHVDVKVAPGQRYNLIIAGEQQSFLDCLLPGGYLILDENATFSAPTGDVVESAVLDDGVWIVRRRPIPPIDVKEIELITRSGVSVVTYVTPDLDHSLGRHLDWVRQWCPQGRVHAFGPHDLSASFREANKGTLAAARGAGYWLWKPYVILATLLNSSSEFVAYCDAGSRWRISWAEVEKTFRERPDCHMMAPQHSVFRERDYTKRDVFITVGADDLKYANTTQIAGTCNVWRRNAKSIEFVRDWLAYACIPGLITDEPNKLGSANYPGFVDNRHDQSIYSLLIKKRGGAILRNYEADVEQRVFR